MRPGKAPGMSSASMKAEKYENINEVHRRVSEEKV